MPQSFASVTLHLVFSTKNRTPWLTDSIRERVWSYLGGTIRGYDCTPLTIGGIADHIHLLIGLGRAISIADLIQRIKSASTRWIHDSLPDLADFSWQRGYGAFSVSHDRVAAVKQYIDHQEEHHRVRTFQEEYREFLTVHGVSWDERYVWD
jgi:REP element-mobilizing transposase RayT